MKYKGRKIAASSLLTILGVVCFATMIVAAVLVASSALNFGTTTVTTASISLSKTSSPTSAFVGNTANYVFSANVAQALTGAGLTIYVNKSGISTSDLQNQKVVVTYNAGTPTDCTVTDNGDSLTATYPIGAQAINAAVPCTIAIVYAITGDYNVAVIMTGTA